MAQLNVRLRDDQYEALHRYAQQRRTPIAWLIKDYVDYLVGGGQPIRVAAEEEVDGRQIGRLAEAAGALDWLRD
jgi:hypothetical protein